MKKRKKRDSFAALLTANAVPRTEIEPSPPRETIWSFRRAEEERERREAERRRDIAERPIRELEEQIRQAAKELHEVQARALFINASEELASRCQLIPENVGGSVEEIRAAIRGAFDTFRLDVEKDGTRFEQSGLQKLNLVTTKNLDIDWRVPKNWRALFEYLEELGALTDHDRTRRASVPVEQPVPEPEQSLDEILNSNSTESREGRKQIATAIMRDMQGEAKRWFEAFYDSIVKNFNYSLTQEETKRVTSYMLERDLNFCLAKSWDAARIHCVRSNLLPNHLLYPAERLSEELEGVNLATLPYDKRTELKRRLREVAI